MTTAADPRFVEATELFNAGRHFDAHEEWEHVWRACPQSDRRFVQSLIHAAVALYQWSRGNAAAARTQVQRGSAKAADYPPVYLGVALGRLWADVKSVVNDGGSGSVLVYTGDVDA